MMEITKSNFLNTKLIKKVTNASFKKTPQKMQIASSNFKITKVIIKVVEYNSLIIKQQ